MSHRDVPGLIDRAAGQWFELSLMEQLGNVGTEVACAARAKEAGDASRAWSALERALELFDLTIADQRWRGPKLREICRAREVVCDYLVGDNQYGSTAALLDAYFLPFAIAARRHVDMAGAGYGTARVAGGNVFELGRLRAR